MNKPLKNIPVNAVDPSINDIDFDYNDDDEEDTELIKLVKERLANDSGIRYTWEEMLESVGITQDELDAMKDVEIE
ncbi:MAG: hypothetical protein IJ862_01710 [Selenomonadaceae bacterium]|nr:hypothetical protein [Selenomonadaceae bacterium]